MRYLENSCSLSLYFKILSYLEELFMMQYIQNSKIFLVPVPHNQKHVHSIGTKFAEIAFLELMISVFLLQS